MFYITPTQVSWVYCYSSHAPSHLPHPSPLLTPSSHVPFRPLIPRPFSSPHPSPLPTSRIPRPFSSPCLSCPFSSSLSGSGKALEKFAENSSANRFRLGGLVKEGSRLSLLPLPAPHLTSVRIPAGSIEMEFVVTDLATDILVRFRGALPDLFREGHSVVAEGFLRPLSEANTAAFTGSSIASASSSSGFSGRGATVLGVAEAEGAVVERGIGEGGARGEGGGVGEKGVGEWEEGEDVSASARSVGYFFAATEVLAKHDEKYMPKEVAAALEKNRAAIEAAGEGDDTSDGEGEGKDDGERSVGEAQKGNKSSVGSGGGAAGTAALGMGDGAKKPGKLSKLGQSPSVAQGYDIPS
ncbi:unnamed protein product [Closterium sp. NIES-65]|nr:unnamed protein product [Closterium sp. NIES-65]